MGPKLVYPALIEAITEVKEIMPVALVFLLSDGYQVVGEYPDLGATAAPEDYDSGDIVVVISKSGRVKLQLEAG